MLAVDAISADRINLLNRVSITNRLVSLESLAARPLQGSKARTINMKLDTFCPFESSAHGLAESTDGSGKGSAQQRLAGCRQHPVVNEDQVGPVPHRRVRR